MATVEIDHKLLKQIQKKFKGESHRIIDLLESLEKNPHKGKRVGSVGGILIKELKYKGFRFYFLVDGNKLKVLSYEELTDLLIRFVRISDKKDQQKVIEEIKHTLRNIEDN